MPPYELIDVPDGDAPQEYVLSPNEQGRLSSVTFTCDGSAAAADFHPTVSFYAPSGELLARQFAELQTAGEVSEVTFAPFLRRPREPAAGREDELPSLCGGMGAGPFAQGTDLGDTLVLTVERDLECDALVVVVPALLSLGTPLKETGAPDDVYDSHGNHFGSGVGDRFSIGAIRQTVFFPAIDVLLGGNSWWREYVAGSLAIGDTITVHWDLDYPANATVAAMCFAIINVSPYATEQRFGASGPFVYYTNADQYPDTSADPTALDWCADLGQCNPLNPQPEHFGMGLALAASYPDCLPYSPWSGVVIGELGGWGAALVVTMDRCLHDDDTTYDPGGQWDVPAQMLVGNYQFSRLVCPP